MIELTDVLVILECLFVFAAIFLSFFGKFDAAAYCMAFAVWLAMR